MTTQHLIRVVALADDGLWHLRAEYGGSTLCQKRSRYALSSSETGRRTPCSDCQAKK